MTRTYKLVVQTIDERGRVRFREAEPQPDENPTPGEPRFALSFDPGYQHGYTPGQSVELKIVG